MYYSGQNSFAYAILQECKIKMVEIKPYFFSFLRFFLGQNRFNSLGIVLIKMSSQVITNGNIIMKRVTYLQIVTQCNICTNVKVFFCALRKIHKQTVQGLKKHLLSGNNVHCSKNEKVKKCLHSLSLFF